MAGFLSFEKLTFWYPSILEVPVWVRAPHMKMWRFEAQRPESSPELLSERPRTHPPKSELRLSFCSFLFAHQEADVLP